MHYLFVYPSQGIWGGIETQIVRMSHWLVQRGHTVTVITISDSNWGPLLPDGARSVALGDQYWKLYYYFRAKRIWNDLRLPRPDVVKTFNWELDTAWIGYQLAVITRARAVAGFYGPVPDLRRLRPGFELRNFLHNFPTHARIFMSPEQIEELEEAHGHSGTLWLLPVDSDQFLPAVRNPVWGRLVSIGRMSDMKQYNLYMIDVVAELRRRGHDVTWTVHGTGDYEPEMRESIRAQGLEQAITLAGPMPYEQCRRALAEAYAFVGMGTTVLEASLFGVPNVLALVFDREGVTYGPIYRVPLGSVGDTRKEPPTGKVVDELERILMLTPEEYAAESDRVREYAQPYDTDASMRHFVELIEAAPRPRRRVGPCVGNYLRRPGRHVAWLWRKHVRRSAPTAA
jgi:glycosyltransferase involved in cell wall biosynthesis